MRNLRKFMVVMTVIAALTVAIIPASAQEQPPSAYPTNTITVTGTGTAYGAPDMAIVSVGSEVIGTSARDAFGQVNSTVQAIIDAVTALGVERADIRTNYLSIYLDYSVMPYPMMEMPMMEPAQPMSTEEPGTSTEQTPPRNYRASNTVEITVRDIANIEAVIDAAIDAGATSLNGLTFTLSDPAALESEARTSAMEDARTRATQLAELAGATLGDVIIISETPGAFYGPVYDMAQGRGGGNTVVEPGQSAVNVSLQVTFSISR